MYIRICHSRFDGCFRTSDTGRQFFGSDLRHFYAAKKFAKFMTSSWKTEWRPNGGHRIPDVAKNCENLYFLERPKMKKVFFELCLSSS